MELAALLAAVLWVDSHAAELVRAMPPEVG